MAYDTWIFNGFSYFTRMYKYIFYTNVIYVTFRDIAYSFAIMLRWRLISMHLGFVMFTHKPYIYRILMSHLDFLLLSWYNCLQRCDIQVRRYLQHSPSIYVWIDNYCHLSPFIQTAWSLLNLGSRIYNKWYNILNEMSLSILYLCRSFS